MMQLLINKKKLLDALESDPASATLRLVIRKIVKVKPRGATHIVCLKNDPGYETCRTYKVVGSGIKDTLPIKKNPDLDFFMVYAEDGGQPTMKHPTLAQAQSAADKVRVKADKRVYILRPIQFLEPVAVVEEHLNNTSELHQEEFTEKDVFEPKRRERKKIPNPANKVNLK